MIDKVLIQKFMMRAGDVLSGDWLIVGGSVLSILGIETRVTYDIDISPPANATQADTILLMDIAKELGLPVEAINTAAS
jgi:hypothetical protein